MCLSHTSRPRSRAGEITVYVIVSALTAACSGLIFGYNIGISGGVAAMDDFLQQFLPKLLENRKQATESYYCKFNDQGLQAFTSSMYIAGLISSFLASYMTRRHGRRPTLILAGFLSIFGVALTALGHHLAMLIIGRVLLGFATGLANQAAPIYLSEIAPPRLRGLLNITFQMNIAIGILCANVVNYSVGYIQHDGWRVALGGAGLPALMLAFGSMMLVESPISLIERGRLEEGKSSLQKVRGTKDVEEEFEQMIRASEAAQAIQYPFRNLLKQKNRPQLIISVLLSLFQQLTGINAIMFYAPVLFETLGFQNSASLYSAAIIGAVNVFSTIMSMLVVDKLGRKILLLEAGLQMLIAQVAIAAILGTSVKEELAEQIPHSSAIVVVLLICLFVAGFGWSWGPMTWLICSEMFPLEMRSAGQSIVVFVNLFSTFCIAQAFLSMLCAMQYGIFLFFAGWVAIMSLFVLLFVPETKGIPMDSIDQLWKKHWIWRRIVPPQASQNGGSSNHAATMHLQAEL